MRAPNVAHPLPSERWLTLPTPDFRERSAERANKLVSVVLVMLAVLGLISTIVQWANGASVAGVYAAIGAAVGAIVIAFLLNRTKRLLVAGLIATSVPTIAGLAVVLADPADPGWFAFMALNPVLGRLFLPMRWSISLAAVNLVAVVAAVGVAGVERDAAIVAVVFNTIVFVLSTAGAWYRNAVEGDRRRTDAERSMLAELIVEATFGGLAVVRRGDVVDANKTFEAQFCDRGELQSCGRPLADFFSPSGLAVFDAVADKATGRPVEVEAVRCDGTTFDAEVLLRQTSVGGEPATVLAVRDISERKRASESLARADRVDSIARLASVVAHDANNELFVISGLSEALREEQAAAGRSTSTATQIEHAAGRVATLIRRVLLYDRLDASERQPVDIVAFVDDHSETWGHVLGRRVALHVGHEDEVGEVEVVPARLAQAMLNIVLNASDSIDGDGRVFVGTSAVWVGASDGPGVDLPAGRYQSIRVRDTGAGIPEEHLPYVFDAFYTTKGEELGSGLGLYASRETVREAGGDIAIETSESGTAVTIYLPDRRFRAT